MKTKFHFSLFAVLLCYIVPYAQTNSFDLHTLVKEKRIRVFNRELSLIDEPTKKGIQMNKTEGEGVAWIKGIDFSEGTIEFDVRGENVFQHSFVGLAFHGVNDTTFDAVYLRPFHFKALDEVSMNRRIQYISLPEFTWRVLRAKFPTHYENTVEPAPDPDAWFRVKIVVKGDTVSTFINNKPQASLVVKKVTKTNSGAIGFYVADTSGGDFANLVITSEK